MFVVSAWAQRIVELGSCRQVIIFTHDVSFILDLKRAAEAATVNDVWTLRTIYGEADLIERLAGGRIRSALVSTVAAGSCQENLLVGCSSVFKPFCHLFPVVPVGGFDMQSSPRA